MLCFEPRLVWHLSCIVAPTSTGWLLIGLDQTNQSIANPTRTFVHIHPGQNPKFGSSNPYYSSNSEISDFFQNSGFWVGWICTNVRVGFVIDVCFVILNQENPIGKKSRWTVNITPEPVAGPSDAWRGGNYHGRGPIPTAKSKISFWKKSEISEFEE